MQLNKWELQLLSLVDGDAVFDRAQQRIVEQFLFEQRTVDPVDIPVLDVEEPAEVYSVPQERVQQRNVEQRVGVPLGLDQLVPQERVQQRPVAQVVDVHVPPVPVSASLVEQVVDVPVPDNSGLVPRHTSQQNVGSSAAALDAAEEQFHGVFRTFLQPKKSAKVASQSSAELLSHSRPPTSTTFARSQAVYIPRGGVVRDRGVEDGSSLPLEAH